MQVHEANPIKNVIEKSKKAALEALLFLYQRQTLDEQKNKTTVYNNSVGFSAKDADILTSFVKYYQKNNYLTEKQYLVLCNRLPRYWRQLSEDPRFYDLNNFIENPVVSKKELIKTKEQRYSNKYACLKEETVEVYFPYNPETVTNVRSLFGRKFISTPPKHWVIPVTLDNLEKLHKWGFKFDTALQNQFNNLKDKPLNDQIIDSVDLPGEFQKLFPYQKQAINFLEKRQGSGLLAHEMGLGKTIMVLGYLQKNPDLRPAVVVCPASLKLNWKKEIERWMTNQKIEILEGKTPYSLSSRVDIFIINYDILFEWNPTLLQIDPSIIVADEVHYIKSTSARRTIALRGSKSDLKKKRPAVRGLAKGRRFIALTGTPVINRPIELYNAISLIDPKLFRSGWAFKQRFCGAFHNGFGWDFNGASNTDELHRILTQGGPMLRRRKVDVLSDLPNKIHSFIPLQLTSSKNQEYQVAKNSFFKYLKEKKGIEAVDKASQAETLVKIEELKQIAVQGKLNQAIQWIQDFLNDSDGKLVVFCTHTDPLDQLMQEFSSLAVKVDGQSSQNSRSEAINRFQNDLQCRLFVGNIRAAGVGLTLTAASSVAFLELPWTPGELVQAEDRCHRIGQKKTVNIYYLLAVSTIEKDIANLLDKKRNIVEQVTDGAVPESNSLFSELIKSIQSNSND